MNQEKVVAKMMMCPECGRLVPVEKVPYVSNRESGPLTRVLWFARHLRDRTALSQDLCKKSGRIAVLVEPVEVSA